MGQFIRENRYFLITTLMFLLIVFIQAQLIPYGNEICLLNPFRHEPLNTLFIYWTKLGEEIIWIMAIILLALFKNYRSSLIALMIGFVVIVSAYFSKTVYQTPRPAKFFSEHNRTKEVVFVPNIEVFTGKTSFPSGHTMSGFAFWGIVAFIFKRRFWIDLVCGLLACGVGFSRIFLCQHFLIDVGAGGALGLLIFLIFWQISHFPGFLSAPVFQKKLIAG